LAEDFHFQAAEHAQHTTNPHPNEQARAIFGRQKTALSGAPACSMLGDTEAMRSQRGANSAKSHGFQG